MAEVKLKQIAAEIRARWESVEGIEIVQRIGRHILHTPTVVVGMHRRTLLYRRI
jgi:MoaE-MoaD fusion protein